MVLENLLNLSLNVCKTPINNIAYPLEGLVVMIMYDNAYKMVKGAQQILIVVVILTWLAANMGLSQNMQQLKLFLQAAKF